MRPLYFDTGWDPSGPSDSVPAMIDIAWAIGTGPVERRRFAEGKQSALDAFFSAALSADTWVAHNIEADLTRLLENGLTISPTGPVQFCTMRKNIYVCELAHIGHGVKDAPYKWPKLLEAYDHYYGRRKLYTKKQWPHWAGRGKKSLRDVGYCRAIHRAMLAGEGKPEFLKKEYAKGEVT